MSSLHLIEIRAGLELYLLIFQNFNSVNYVFLDEVRISRDIIDVQNLFAKLLPFASNRVIIVIIIVYFIG